MLNIIGGLDKYTSGDLRINGVSTKDYKDRDWDAYRNNSIGFVFQSYNLIPHQTVLSNVELALTLSGVSKAERRKRAVEALARSPASLRLGSNAILGVTWPAVPPPVNIIFFIANPHFLNYNYCLW